jgi:hypothetical protein
MATWLISRTPEGGLRLRYSPCFGAAWDCGMVEEGASVEAIVQWICLRETIGPFQRILLPDSRVLVFLPHGGSA